VDSLHGCRVLRLRPSSVGPDTEIGRCLSGWGLEHETVSSVRDAIARLLGSATQHTPFEVLILDEPEVSDEMERFVDSLDRDLGLFGLTVLMRCPHGADVRPDSALGRRAHLLRTPLDKALLFNALHASFAGAHDDTVISFAEHVGRRRPPGREVRVLVAEDNATNRMVIGRILERAGFRHRLVHDGQQVLEALEKESFDLAIVDMQMPGLSGIEAYKLYRFAHADDPHPVPFVVLSANATVEARRQARDAGIDHYLTKPVASSQLLRAIAEVTGGTRATGTEPEPATAGAGGAEANDELDPSQLADLLALASGGDFGDRLVEGFRADGASLLEQMDGTLRAGEAERFRELAHAFKGSAANLGLIALTRQAAGIEQLSDTELSSDGRRHMSALAQGLDRALEALAAELQHRRTTG
jgi:two-component system sensor histidine kinase RpfC